MTFTASMRWQVNNGGTDGSSGQGGGFDPGGCTFDNTASVASANTSAPVVTWTNYTFVANDVGHWWYGSAGTGLIAGWYPIASVAAGLATLNAAIGAAQLLTGGLNTVVGCSASSSISTISCSVDYSRKAAGTAGITFTDMIIGATTTDFTSVLNPIGPNMIGNVIAVSSGTGFTQQRAQILSIPASVTARCDRTLGTTASTGGNSKLGGALLTIGQAGALHNTSQGIYVKYNATTFSSAITTNNAATGRLTLSAGTSTAMSFIRGFDTVCGDEYTPTNGLNRPTLKWGNAVNAATNGLITATVNFIRIENLILDGNTGSATNSRGLTLSGSLNDTIINNCKFINFNSSALNGGGILYNCEFASNVSTNVIAPTSSTLVIQYCSFHDNTVNCISSTGSFMILNYVNFYNNTGANTNNVQTTGTAFIAASNVTMGTVGKHGYDIQAALNAALFTNCYVQGASGNGWNFGTAMDTAVMKNCGGYNNTSGNFDVTKLTNSFDQIGFLLPSADVFTNLAGGDLTLNNTAGAGAVLRVEGWPSTYPGMTGTNYSDVGAYQHQDAGGSSGTAILAGEGIGLVVT